MAAILSPNWIPAHMVYWVSVVLMQFGLVGLYARQVKDTGWLGLAGFVLAFVGTNFVASILVMVSAVIPLVAREAPVMLTTATPPILALAVLVVGIGMGYVLFGAATIRAGVLPRLSGLLLIVGVSLFIASEVLLFDPTTAHVAVTVGDLLLGFGFARVGYTLWSEGRTASAVIGESGKLSTLDGTSRPDAPASWTSGLRP